MFERSEIGWSESFKGLKKGQGTSLYIHGVSYPGHVMELDGIIPVGCEGIAGFHMITGSEDVELDIGTEMSLRAGPVVIASAEVLDVVST